MGKIFCLGGGGYCVDADPKLDAWWLGLAGKQRPRVLFIPTASGDSLFAIDQFTRAFESDADIRVLRLFQRTTTPLEEMFQDIDIVYVLGGNTANLLAIWRAHLLDEPLRHASERGVVLGGLSAGAICWGLGGTTDSFGDINTLEEGLGLLPFTFSPHHEESRRAEVFEGSINLGILPPGFGIDNGVGLLFEDGKIAGAVSERPSARAVFVGENGSEYLPIERL